MAVEGKNTQQTLVAAADYSALGNDYKVFKIDTAAPRQAILVANAGVRADGVMTNHPALGQPVEAVTDGYTKARCGAAVASSGLELTPDATGRLVAAVSTNIVFAISLSATAAAGEFVEIDMSCGRYPKP